MTLRFVWNLHRRLRGDTPLGRDLAFVLFHKLFRRVFPRWVRALSIRYEAWRLCYVIERIDMEIDKHG